MNRSLHTRSLIKLVTRAHYSHSSPGA